MNAASATNVSTGESGATPALAIPRRLIPDAAGTVLAAHDQSIASRR
jgi:hypothetical protein